MKIGELRSVAELPLSWALKFGSSGYCKNKKSVKIKLLYLIFSNLSYGSNLIQCFGSLPWECLDGLAQSLPVGAFQGLPGSLVVGFKELVSCYSL